MVYLEIQMHMCFPFRPSPPIVKFDGTQVLAFNGCLSTNCASIRAVRPSRGLQLAIAQVALGRYFNDTNSTPGLGNLYFVTLECSGYLRIWMPVLHAQVYIPI